MKVLKKSTRNAARPEGSIAEAYITAEAIEFCSEYLPGLPSIGLPTGKNVAYEFDEGMLFSGKAMKGKAITADPIGWEQAHRCVLRALTSATPYIM